MKTIFIVDYWMPFPSSEYGGVDVVIADNAEEAIELLAKEDESDYTKEKYPDYRERIAKEVTNARTFPVQADRSEVVYRFDT